MTSCSDVMRMMINVHPKRHHEHRPAMKRIETTKLELPTAATTIATTTTETTTNNPTTTSTATTTIEEITEAVQQQTTSTTEGICIYCVLSGNTFWSFFIDDSDQVSPETTLNSQQLGNMAF